MKYPYLLLLNKLFIKERTLFTEKRFTERTDDREILALYQLSYNLTRVRPTGLEPATSRLTFEVTLSVTTQ